MLVSIDIVGVGLDVVVVAVSLNGASLSGPSFSGFELDVVDVAVVVSLKGALCTGASLSGASFSGFELDVVDVAVVSLKRALFTGASLSGPSFRVVELDVAVVVSLIKFSLIKVSFTGTGALAAFGRGTKAVATLAKPLELCGGWRT
jgi:uncharacterized protein YjbI with pentapeptide repeats